MCSDLSRLDVNITLIHILLKGPATTPPPRGAGWEPKNDSTRTGIFRAKRVMLELSWCCGVATEALSTSVAITRHCHDRTEDYQQTGYQNHPTDALLVSRTRPLKSYGLRPQNRGSGRSIGHL